jgi:hypothetical protein
MEVTSLKIIAVSKIKVLPKLGITGTAFPVNSHQRLTKRETLFGKTKRKKLLGDIQSDRKKNLKLIVCK